MDMIAKTVSYFDGEIECIGQLSIPESSEVLPIVLVAHTWKGRSKFEDQKAQALNELGYAALSIDIYGGGVNGQSVQENQTLIEPFISDRQLFRQRLISAVEFAKILGALIVSVYCFD